MDLSASDGALGADQLRQAKGCFDHERARAALFRRVAISSAEFAGMEQLARAQLAAHARGGGGSGGLVPRPALPGSRSGRGGAAPWAAPRQPRAAEADSPSPTVAWAASRQRRRRPQPRITLASAAVAASAASPSATERRMRRARRVTRRGSSSWRYSTTTSNSSCYSSLHPEHGTPRGRKTWQHPSREAVAAAAAAAAACTSITNNPCSSTRGLRWR